MRVTHAVPMEGSPSSSRYNRPTRGANDTRRPAAALEEERGGGLHARRSAQGAADRAARGGRGQPRTGGTPGAGARGAGSSDRERGRGHRARQDRLGAGPPAGAGGVPPARPRSAEASRARKAPLALALSSQIDSLRAGLDNHKSMSLQPNPVRHPWTGGLG